MRLFGRSGYRLHLGTGVPTTTCSLCMGIVHQATIPRGSQSQLADLLLVLYAGTTAIMLQEPELYRFELQSLVER